MRDHKEWEAEMFEKYADFFLNKDNKQVSLMSFGFCVGPGWQHIVETLLDNLTWYAEWNTVTHAKRVHDEFVAKDEEPPEWTYPHLDKEDPMKGFEVLQVKEKFATLRFYYRGGDGFVRGLVHMAESMSAVTCERCGNVGSVGRSGTGWVSVRCDACRVEKEEYEK